MLSIFLLYLPFACSEKEQDSAVVPPPIDTNTIDDDGDGFTEDDGDCDDEDPLTFPGVAEHEAVFACMTDSDGDGWGSDEPKFGVASGSDCDDTDPNMNNDDVDGDGIGGCEGDCDDNDAFQNLRDNDGDGYASCNGDCDDNDPLIHPGAAELESITACMQDADQDGWGAQIPPNGIEAGTDCDDSDARLSHTDLDGDGFSSCNNDCDDNSAALYPYDMDGDGTSPCDGDCDDTDATLNRSDLDNDGFTSCVNDCNDNDATVFPNADERCDGQYNDCNSPDYDTTLPPIPERDSDGDGSVECEEDGSTWVGSSTVLGYADCDDNSPSYNQNDSDGDGHSTCDGDCDDNDEFTFPGIASLDSSTACMTDNDGDGYGAVQNCCYELIMTDNFGDGWNGGYITVYEDNISIGTYSVTESEGSTSTDTICISDGSVFLLQYTAGLREGENSYSLYDPNGTLVYSAGPQPTIGDVYTDHFFWNGFPSCILKLGIDSGTDCDDTLSSVNPSATEIYNDDIDNNCNNITDGQSTAQNAEIGFAGETSGEQLGYWLSLVRDVNGDSYADLLISTPNNDDVGSDAGKIYLFSGAALTDGTYPVDTAPLQILGELAGDLAGSSISSAGDIDGDERFDILIGAPFNDDAGNAAGKAYLFRGSSLGIGTISVQSADITFTGENLIDLAGSHVATAGDIDDDGYDDILIGAEYSDTGGNRSGQVYLFLGSGLSATTYSLSEANTSFYGENAEDQMADAQAAGDVDGDGLDDIIIGSMYNDDGGSDAGKAYLVYGSSITQTSLPISLSDLAFVGESQEDYAASAIKGCGDVNGDGLEDLLIGAYGHDANGEDSGKTYLITNSSMLTSAISLSNATTYFYGESSQDRSGFSLDSVGDLDNDGYREVIIGAPNNSEVQSNAGKVYVYYSSSIGTGSHPLADADLSYTGISSNNYLGSAITAPGDLNNDGIKDLVLGAPGHNANGANTGRVHIFLNPFE